MVHDSVSLLGTPAHQIKRSKILRRGEAVGTRLKILTNTPTRPSAELIGGTAILISSGQNPTLNIQYHLFCEREMHGQYL